MTTSKTIPPCPICTCSATELFYQDKKREYRRCPQCDLVFVPPEFHLAPETEKARYDCHQHSLTDPGYRAFLERLFQPLKTKISPGARGLDFGCGQTPTLSILFEEAGYPCDNYDLHYANDPALLKTQYDFLTCSETMEHFRNPRAEFEQFLQLVKPGGWIAIMTQLRDEAPPFEQWFYKNDATHICFFSRKTVQTLGKAYQLTIDLHENGVILFQRHPTETFQGNKGMVEYWNTGIWEHRINGSVSAQSFPVSNIPSFPYSIIPVFHHSILLFLQGFETSRLNLSGSHGTIRTFSMRE